MLIVIILYDKPAYIFSIAYMSLNWLFIKVQEANKNTSRSKGNRNFSMHKSVDTDTALPT